MDQYSFPNLHAFLDNGGPKEVEVSGSKGKGKASVVGEKKKVVKRKAKDEGNQTENLIQERRECEYIQVE